MSDFLKGQLLVASPSLADYFHRTVVLVLDHSDEGAMGVVLNRPSETAVEEAVPVLGTLAGGEEPVHLGGPVSPQAVVALGDFADPGEAGQRVVGSVGVLNPDGEPATLRRLRVFAGYAGWGPGQLETELEQDAWIVEPAEAEDVFAADDLWASVLARKGGEYSLLATMPADPSLN